MTVLILFLICFIYCADRKYAVLISDTHIGGDNFAGLVRTALPNFLRTMTKPETDVHTFVFVGDVFDMWARNYTEPNPTVTELLKMQDYRGVNISEYVDLLKQMLKNGVEVKYIRGNHDIIVTYEDLKNVGLEDVSFYPLIWEEHNFQVEHGNRFDIWNAPDPSNTILPFGYFVTRSYYQSGGYEKQKMKRNLDGPYNDEWYYGWPCKYILSYIVDLLKDAPWLYERVIGGALGETVWGEIANKKYQERKHDILKNGCVYNTWSDEEMGRAVGKYTSTVRRFIEKFGEEYTQNLVRGMCHDPSWFYKQIEKDLFVQGHYHTPEINVIKTNSGRMMVTGDTGSWTKGMSFLPFIRMTQPNKENVTFVELMEYKEDGEKFDFIVKASSFVPYRDSKKLVEKKGKVYHQQDGKNVPGVKKNITRREVPKGWLCDENWYNSNDGCDCGCGVPDPDCQCTKSTSSCEYSCCSN